MAAGLYRWLDNGSSIFASPRNCRIVPSNVEQLGPYRLGRLLGRGGMGAVYEGIDSESEQPVAVKVLSVHLADAEGFRERFAAEVETLKKLRHPNIVRLFAYGEQEGYRYYAMELVEGASLEEELRAGRKFDWQEVTRIGIRMCRALKHAHDHGVIHRDIKPANLLLSNNGEVKLSDFGIAKLFGSTGLTATGGVVGTAEYMAPEQADGRPTTSRTDLYSLGGLMYALLAQRPPFVARNIVEMLDKQRSAIPDPVRRYAPDTPEELEGIIAELLAKDPNKRIRSAMILGRRLEAMEHGLARRAERVAANGSTLANQPSRKPGEADVPPTADATQVSTRNVAPPAEIHPREAHFSETMSTEVSDDAEGRIGPPRSVVVPPPERAAPATQFTRVREDDELARDRLMSWSNPDGSVISPATIWALAIVLAIAGGVWWKWLHKPSAESLYDRISATNGRPERLVDVEQDINLFLEYYPTDPRTRELEGYREDITLAQLERRLERRSRQRNKDAELAPVEQAYTEAISRADTNPEQALARLQALIDLYQDSNVSDETRRCLVLAQRRVIRLQRQVDELSSGQITLLEQRLDRAEDLQTDEPEQARRICHGVIELFAEKPWADDLVARARRILAELP